MHVLPDGVRVTTLAVEDDQAVVEIATRVVNQTRMTATPTVRTTITDPDSVTVEGDATFGGHLEARRPQLLRDLVRLV